MKIIGTDSPPVPDKFVMKTAQIMNLTGKELTFLPKEAVENALEAEVTGVDLSKNYFKEFPTNLFGYRSGQFTKFLSDHEASLVPLVLFHAPNVATLDMLEETLEVETHILVKRNFRALIQLAFPGIAAKASTYTLPVMWIRIWIRIRIHLDP